MSELKQYAEMWAQTPTGANYASKAAIKRALATTYERPSFVELGTVANGFTDTRWTVEELAAELAHGKTLTIVGPDPYTKRTYFGSLRASKGALRIS